MKKFKSHTFVKEKTFFFFFYSTNKSNTYFKSDQVLHLTHTLSKPSNNDYKHTKITHTKTLTAGKKWKHKHAQCACNKKQRTVNTTYFYLILWILIILPLKSFRTSGFQGLGYRITRFREPKHYNYSIHSYITPYIYYWPRFILIINLRDKTSLSNFNSKLQVSTIKCTDPCTFVNVLKVFPRNQSISWCLYEAKHIWINPGFPAY